jgi:hypothetical protein
MYQLSPHQVIYNPQSQLAVCDRDIVQDREELWNSDQPYEFGFATLGHPLSRIWQGTRE